MGEQVNEEKVIREGGDLVTGNRKVEVKKVGDLDKVEEVDGRFLVHSYIGRPGEDARAITVEQSRNEPVVVSVKVARVIYTGDWVDEYYVVIKPDGAVVYQGKEANFMAFDYEYIPWNEDTHLELRFWFDYQEVVVLEVNLGKC